MLLVLDIFLDLFHASWILMVVAGWILPALRRWHFYFVMLTLFSWVALGYFYGWGYCILTDIHWDVKRKVMVEFPSFYSSMDYLPASFVKYAIDRLFRMDADPLWVDGITIAGLAVGLASSIYFMVKSQMGYSKDRNR